jgi:dephospho-CoA kinase
LTGGIGSGKSTAANLLAESGAAIIDTDVIAHALTAPGGAAIAALREEFGAEFIAANGALDRARMRSLAFSNDDARKRLERILHPMIRAETVAAASRNAAAPYVVFVVPLLVESGSWVDRVDRVLVVDCSPGMQVVRVARRSGLAPGDVMSIAARQASRAQRLAAADDVVVNEGTPGDLVPRMARVHAAYLRLASDPAARRALAP